MARRIAMRDAFVASRVTVHVLITTTSGSSLPSAKRAPRPSRSSAIRSDSAWFSRQPSVVKATVGEDMAANLPERSVVIHDGSGRRRGSILGAKDPRAERHELSSGIGQGLGLV